MALSVPYRALPAQVRDRPSRRQQQALLPMKDARARSRLARRAIDDTRQRIRRDALVLRERIEKTLDGLG